MLFKFIDQPGWLSEVECNPKMSISLLWVETGGRWGLNPSTNHANHQKLNIIQKWAFHFLAGEVWQMLFEFIYQPGWSSEVECNPKMNISFFCLGSGGGWGSSPLNSPANHQMLKVIQKCAFHVFGCRGVLDGARVHWPARLNIGSCM